MLQMLILSYILMAAWLVTSVLLAVPVAALALLWYLVEFRNIECINLENYGQYDCLPVLFQTYQPKFLLRFTYIFLLRRYIEK